MVILYRPIEGEEFCPADDSGLIAVDAGVRPDCHGDVNDAVGTAGGSEVVPVVIFILGRGYAGRDVCVRLVVPGCIDPREERAALVCDLAENSARTVHSESDGQGLAARIADVESVVIQVIGGSSNGPKIHFAEESGVVGQVAERADLHAI